MSADPVIVFGPTGKVGSQVAHHVASAGVKTILAMRDTSKSVPMDASQTRVKADLSDPSSIVSAVKESGAKSAFIYVPPGTQDGMRGTIKALKDGGIEFVVFLSSYSINVQETDLASIGKDKWIPYIHASVELILESFFKDSYVAIRAGRFATNTLTWSPGIRAGKVKIYKPDFLFDYVSAADLGRVSASVLASTDKASFPRDILVMGPDLITQKDAIAIIGKAIGKDIAVEDLTMEDAKQGAMAGGMPENVADYIFGEFRDRGNGEYSEPYLQEGLGNIERYTGHKPETLETWVQNNKAAFTS